MINDFKFEKSINMAEATFLKYFDQANKLGNVLRVGISIFDDNYQLLGFYLSKDTYEGYLKTMRQMKKRIVKEKYKIKSSAADQSNAEQTTDNHSCYFSHYHTLLDKSKLNAGDINE